MFRIGLVVVAFFFACGGEAPDFEPAIPEILPQADSSSFDVEWSPEVRIAAEADVFADVENLQPADSIFRVRPGSPLLQDVTVGSLVLWPQLGLFEVLDLVDEGERIAVEVEWAPFSRAMTRADIQFEHIMQEQGPGTVFGVAPATMGSLEGGLRQGLFDSAVLYRFLRSGVSYSGGDWQVQLRVDGDQARFAFDSSNSAFASHMDATASGLSAQGRIQIDPNDPEHTPVASLVFPRIEVDGTVRIRFEGQSGDAEVLPPVTLVYPFMVGPLPAFLAISVRVAVRSTLLASATMEASADFSMGGTLTLSRGPEGFGIDGGIAHFEQTGARVEFSTSLTAGVSIDVDAPRVSFGFGRPGVGTAALFATHSAELIANVQVDPAADSYCATVSAGSSVLYGGEISALGWSTGVQQMLGGLRAPVTSRGDLCR